MTDVSCSVKPVYTKHIWGKRQASDYTGYINKDFLHLDFTSSSI